MLLSCGRLRLPPDGHTVNALLTTRQKEYGHDEPRFVVRYPGVYDQDEPLDRRQGFLAESRYGQVPVLTIAVTPADARRPLAWVGRRRLCPPAA